MNILVSARGLLLNPPLQPQQHVIDEPSAVVRKLDRIIHANDFIYCPPVVVEEDKKATQLQLPGQLKRGRPGQTIITCPLFPSLSSSSSSSLSRPLSFVEGEPATR